MGLFGNLKSIFASSFLAATLATGLATAQTVDEFYSKNPITLMVGAAAGGSSDEFAEVSRPT